ncbi:MAG TPA: methylmalonyl-CoA epimerase [Vicinamibacterales bacterium]|jgi:methylmalonyl-CoA epimerase|nr:methylmalonyl-CoA epimerase [Vicinamibacterales bacterium]
MKAVLDHVGIAVKDLAAALAFYRDALGLEVEAPEEVTSQRVRAHFLPVGSANLELLEATAPDSPIARYVEKRGPGLHHITLRVEDVHAAVAQLKARGVRMIDEQPRPGAEGSTIAFVHPAAAHGVLIELKQASAHQAKPSTTGVDSVGARDTRVRRFALGDLELVSVSDGFIRLDGGSMFGTVPKPLWEKKAPADARNRITLAMRPLIVRGARTMIIDAGLGDKESAKFEDIYGVERERNLDHTLAEAGLSAEDIDIVLASHLHFDHAGGFTIRDATGRVRPRFPRAQYIVRRGEWDDATHPHERNRASYLLDNYVPLADAGVLQLVDGDVTIMPGVKVRRTGGHTMHHQMVLLESGGKTAAFVADMMPTTAHLPEAWIMGFDLYPMDALAAKKAFVPDAVAHETLVFFEHDPATAAGYIREEGGKRRIEAASGR